MTAFQMFLLKFKTTKLGQAVCGDSSPKLWLISLWSAIAAAILYLSMRFIDTDLFYIIPTGRYILSNGIPIENPFITTPDQGIVIQNWLYCVIVAWVYNHLHTLGLFLLQLVTILGLFVVTFKFFDFKSSTNKIMIGLFTLGMFAMFGYVNLRPEMLTFILCVIEVIGIEKYQSTGKCRYLWLLPLTMFLETNCHASYWIMHIVVMLPYAVPSFKFMRVTDTHIENKDTGKMVPFLLLTVIAAFVNPYHYFAVRYVFDSLLSGVISLSQISEQQPFTINAAWVWAYIALLFIFLVMWWKKMLTSTEFYMYLGMSILFVFAVKWLPFYIFGLMYLLRAMYNRTVGRDGYNIGNLKVPGICSILIICVVLVAGYAFMFRSNVASVFDAKTDAYMDRDGLEGLSYEYLVDMADYLDENDPDASVFAIFELANYFEYRGYIIYADARPELYTEEIAGSDEISRVLFGIRFGGDVLQYKSDRSDADNKDAIDDKMADYYYSASEYSAVVDSLNTDYIVCSNDEMALSYYVQGNPDKYELVVDSGLYKLYKKLV